MSEIDARENAYIAQGHTDARWLAKHAAKGHIAFVTCGYDTAFASIGDQVSEKVRQLSAIFPSDGPLRFSLTIVDDTDPKSRFAGAVQDALNRFDELDGQLFVQPLFSRRPQSRGLKGLALREGFLSAADRGADLFGYLNLNLKVHAAQSASLTRAMLEQHADVAVGSRAPEMGGCAIGRGTLGERKSQVWSHLVRDTFPELAEFSDQNAPLKIFNRGAMGHLLNTCRIDGVTLDSEWLVALLAGGFSLTQLGICWRQRAGSKIPFWAIGPMIMDLKRIKAASERGAFAR